MTSYHQLSAKDFTPLDGNHSQLSFPALAPAKPEEVSTLSAYFHNSKKTPENKTKVFLRRGKQKNKRTLEKVENKASKSTKPQTNNKTFSITLTNYAQQCHALHLTRKYEPKH